MIYYVVSSLLTLHIHFVPPCLRTDGLRLRTARSSSAENFGGQQRGQGEDDELLQCRRSFLDAIAPNTAALLTCQYWAARGSAHAQLALLGMLWSEDKQDYGLAFRYLTRAWGFHPEPSVASVLDRAQLLMKQGQLQEALRAFNSVVDAHPDWSQAYRLRAKCYNQMKNVERTVEDLRMALELNPINFSVMMELGILLGGIGNYDEAWQLLLRAEDMCPCIPGLDMFKRQLLGKEPQLASTVLAPSSAAPLPVPAAGVWLVSQSVDQSVPAALLPAAWAERVDTVQRPSSAFLRLGVELERWTLELRRSQQTPHELKQPLGELRALWDPGRLPEASRALAQLVHQYLEIYLAALDGGDLEEGADADAVEFLATRRRERGASP